MLGYLVLGVLLGAFAARLVHHRHHCAGHGWHGHRCHRGRGRRLFWLVHELGLSGEQVAGLKEAWLSGRGAIARVRAGGFEGLHALWEAAAGEPLDRAKLDEAARRYGDDCALAARALGDAVARAHDILTPEQRAKLRARLGRSMEGGWRGGDGPYRTVL